MKTKIITTLSLFFSLILFSQGLNNDYEIDSEDLKKIFEAQVIHIFKYPFELKKGEYISISYDIYKKGKLSTTKHSIEDFQIKNEIKIDNHIARKDTIVYHRFYFIEQESILKLNQNLPGIEISDKIDLSSIKQGTFNSRSNVPTKLTKKEEILFYYGNNSNDWLNCTTGISKENLIKDYDLVVLFYAEKISKKRTRTILNEIENKAL